MPEPWLTFDGALPHHAAIDAAALEALIAAAYRDIRRRRG